MFVTRKLASPYFRGELLKAYPSLNKNPAYWHMMAYLLLGGHFDEGSDLLIISQNVLAQIEGKQASLASGNYVAREFLQMFKRDVLPKIEWSGHDSRDGRARIIENEGLDLYIWDLAIEEISNPVPIKDRVYLDTGKPNGRAYKYSATKAREERVRLEKEAEQLSHSAETPEAKAILDYLNNISVNTFTKMLEHLDAARETVYTLELMGSPQEKKRSLEANLKLLYAIELQPKPFYQPSKSGNTVRIFPFNPSLLQLKKEVRQVLTQDWHEYDLQSSQLAIVATMWDVKEAQDLLLDAGKDIWSELFTLYDLPMSKEVKKVFKQALYSLVFGMAVASIKSDITRKLKTLDIKQKGALFFTHDVTQALAVARENAIHKIQSHGYGETIFGKRIPVETVLKPAKKGKKGTKSYSTKAKESTNITSILAQQAQAMEFLLIQPAFELAATANDFDIVLFQHDGFSVAYRDESKQQRWEQRIQHVIEEKAKELCVHTKLVSA